MATRLLRSRPKLPNTQKLKSRTRNSMTNRSTRVPKFVYIMYPVRERPPQKRPRFWVSESIHPTVCSFAVSHSANGRETPDILQQPFRSQSTRTFLSRASRNRIVQGSTARATVTQTLKIAWTLAFGVEFYISSDVEVFVSGDKCQEDTSDPRSCPNVSKHRRASQAFYANSDSSRVARERREETTYFVT